MIFQHFPQDPAAFVALRKVASGAKLVRFVCSRKLRLGRVRLRKEVKSKNRHSGRKMSDAIFVANKVSGDLMIGDKHEIDKAKWRRPLGVRLTPTSRYIRDMIFPRH